MDSAPVVTADWNSSLANSFRSIPGGPENDRSTPMAPKCHLHDLGAFRSHTSGRIGGGGRVAHGRSTQHRAGFFDTVSRLLSICCPIRPASCCLGRCCWCGELCSRTSRRQPRRPPGRSSSVVAVRASPWRRRALKFQPGCRRVSGCGGGGRRRTSISRGP